MNSNLFEIQDSRFKIRDFLRRTSFVLSLLIFVSSCATYYQSNYSFNQEFENGDLENALNSLRSKPGEEKGHREFLYKVNNGLVLSMLGRYEESNEYFEQAYLFGEDYRKNYLLEATSYLTNPNFTPYKGEDHEHLMLLYYKAINYMKMNRSEEALVECRRLNIRLQQLSDRYNVQDKYKEDGFVHLLMGIIFETDKDFNNAFIAYRNAYRIYQSSFHDLFGMEAPEQLKTDLLRTAWRSGLIEEFKQWKDELGMPGYMYHPDDSPQLVFFWHNGLSPVKAEWGINFVISKKDKWIFFNNSDLRLQFPFSMEGYDEKDKRELANLEVFRVAFPRYIERPVYFQHASLSAGAEGFELERAEDISGIAFKSLDQRMNFELSKALLRVALKKAAEYEVRKSDKTLGAVLGVINAITEKADTRNWQTLPHEIFYARVPLRVGKNKITLKLQSSEKSESAYDFEYEARKGQILFHTFTSLESKYPAYGFY